MRLLFEIHSDDPLAVLVPPRGMESTNLPIEFFLPSCFDSRTFFLPGHDAVSQGAA